MLLPLKLADKLGSKHTGCELDGKSRPSLRSVSFFQIKKRTLLIDLLGRPRRPVVVVKQGAGVEILRLKATLSQSQAAAAALFLIKVGDKIIHTHSLILKMRTGHDLN